MQPISGFYYDKIRKKYFKETPELLAKQRLEEAARQKQRLEEAARQSQHSNESRLRVE